MFRFVFRSVCVARKSSFGVHETCVLLSKCDRTAARVFRFANGGRHVFSTSSARLCEKKDHVIPANQEKETNKDKDSNVTETVQTKMAEQTQETVVFKADDGNTTQEEMDIKTEQVVATPTQAETDELKSGMETVQIKMAEETLETVVLKADDGSTTQEEMDIKTEQVVAMPTQAETDELKSGMETVQTKMAEETLETVVLKADDRSTTQEEMDIKTEQVVAMPTQAETDEVKSGMETVQTKMAEETLETVVLKADDGSTTQEEMDIKTEQVMATPTQAETDEVKSGKETLLELLGAMKVEVTNKRKLKTLTLKQKYESATREKPKPAGMESTFSMFQEAAEETSSQSEELDPDLVAAASAAASTLPNQSEAGFELLRQLRQRKALTEAQKKGDMSNIGVIIADMKVGRSQQKAVLADQIQFDEGESGYTEDSGITAKLISIKKKRNLLTSKRLNIFSTTTDEEVESAVACPTLWDMNFANHLSLVTNQMPRNGFEEMIQWTKEGKLWQYPINNEVGLEEEASVPFHEHIFLEKHLEEGFPRQGPVRHFMELVVAGLSRNPYLTVQQKKEHISWFRDYFHQKEEVLKEADAYLN